MTSLYGRSRTFLDVVKQQRARIGNVEAIDENRQNSPTIVRRQVPVNRICDQIVSKITRQKTSELALPQIGVTHFYHDLQKRPDFGSHVANYRFSLNRQSRSRLPPSIV